MRKLNLLLLVIVFACNSDDNAINSPIVGQWYLSQIKDNNTGNTRLPKDANGIESTEKLYFLTFNSDGSIQGKTLANDFSGNFSLSGRSDISIDLELISEVLEPEDSDSYYYVDNLEGNLKYEIISGDLYLHYDNNSKCFIFKTN